MKTNGIILRLLNIGTVLTVVFSVVTAFDTGLRDIELFSHFRLQYLVVSTLLLVAMLLLRRFVFVTGLAVALVVNAILVVPFYTGGEPVGSGTPLKLLHTNVHSRNDSYDRLIDLVAGEDPDIIFLQEVTELWANAAAALSTSHPHSYLQPREGHFGIAVFSKLPFQTVRHIDSPPLDHPTIIAEIVVDGQKLNIVSSHPMIPLGDALYDARNEQLRSIADVVSALDGKVVLTGDFNASLWDPKFRMLEQATGLKNVRKGFGVIPTWPTYMPIAMIPIDHVLVSEEIGVREVRTGMRIGSDHLPLVVTVEL